MFMFWQEVAGGVPSAHTPTLLKVNRIDSVIRAQISEQVPLSPVSPPFFQTSACLRYYPVYFILPN